MNECIEERREEERNEGETQYKEIVKQGSEIR